MLISCRGCQKSPYELSEYLDGATEADITPEEYVKLEEGTYNPVTGGFLCTECYIRAGMPSLPYPQTWRVRT